MALIAFTFPKGLVLPCLPCATFTLPLTLLACASLLVDPLSVQARPVPPGSYASSPPTRWSRPCCSSRPQSPPVACSSSTNRQPHQPLLLLLPVDLKAARGAGRLPVTKARWLRRPSTRTCSRWFRDWLTRQRVDGAIPLTYSRDHLSSALIKVYTVHVT